MEKKFFKNEGQRDLKANKIIAMEWDMFQDVNNIGGRAACQDDWDTFYIMRHSQMAIMDDMTLTSYLEDLNEAVLSGRNLMMEKYAHMMESTDPEYYEKELKNNLPGIDDTTKKLAAEIADRMTDAELDFAGKYPKFSLKGRPVTEGSGGDTSIRTYAFGELQTYSDRTLRHFLRSIKALERKNENIAYMVHNDTAKFYGYESVEAAEESL